MIRTKHSSPRTGAPTPGFRPRQRILCLHGASSSLYDLLNRKASSLMREALFPYLDLGETGRRPGELREPRTVPVRADRGR